MMVQGVSISEMANQSVTVLTKPSVQSFEQYERRGGQREGLIYVGVAALIGLVIAALFGLLFGGFGGLIAGIISGGVAPVVGYYVFSYLLYTVGKSQGGTGTQDEVFYTCALYVAPLLALGGIVSAVGPLAVCLAPALLVLAAYQAYLGYLATRSSMNLDQNKAIITAVVAFLGSLVAGGVINWIAALIA